MPTAALDPILYADDEENDAVLLEIGFQRAAIAHPLQLVTDGSLVLDYLAGAAAYADRTRYPLPCLLLLDIKMPRLSGLEVLARVRQDPAFAHLPVVMFSSSQQPVDQQRARELGADDYLVKPTGLDGFVAIARLLDSRWLSRTRE